ncbi:DUF6384 family protein [Rhodanobacter sp. AS-Z3]|uniref:DUF6384 family protein n=1 Tax=Rhodanobacter sp. AS-Z3 TaxID=3031330 RepID=UPI0024792C02|nr:DUF6384 family protein [Rhodanobacter sp. AS-Z3]WEN13600.1 DUF6384 family protein [Rhodanobacter sp. AS-Z3]
MDRRKARLGIALVAVLVLALVGFYFVQSHSYAHWQKTVTPLVADAALMQQDVSKTIRLATNVGTVPLGASVHAEGALMEINKLNGAMRGLIVTSTDPEVLQSTFADHSDAKQVLAHDRKLLALARQHLQLAHQELNEANKVLAYGQKWHDLDPYALQPAGLSPQWLSNAIAMRTALNSGDLHAIEQADLRLETLHKGGQIAQSAATIVGSFSAGDRDMAAPYLATISTAVNQGDLSKAEPALATLVTMQKQAPLSYSLYLLAIPGEKTFVVKPDARDASIQHHYLIVQATNEHGAQVPVDIHDSELDRDLAASRFGVEVSAETFDQVQNGERDGLLLVGKKSSGTVSTVFSLPVLDGRISRW